MAKSVGKLVLFRVEDLLDWNTSFLNSEDFVETVAGPEGYAKGIGGFIKDDTGATVPVEGARIIRNLTNNYEIVDGMLQAPMQYTNISDIMSGPDTTATKVDENKYRVRFGAGTLKDPNLYKYQVSDNPSGIEASPYSFLNHNFHVQRPLSTTIAAHQEAPAAQANFAKYGFDNEMKVLPTYNFYIKQYEEYFSNLNALGGVFTGLADVLNFEKVIPNYYYVMLLLHTLHNDSSDKAQLFASEIGHTTLTLDRYLKWMPSLLNSYTQNPANLSFGARAAVEELLMETANHAERNSVVMLTTDFYKKYNNDIEIQKKVFPYHVEIQIPVIKEGTVFRDILKQANLYDDLQYIIASLLKMISHYERTTDVKYKIKIDAFFQSIQKRYDMYKLLVRDVSDKNELEISWEKMESFPIDEFLWFFKLNPTAATPNYKTEDPNVPLAAVLENNKNFIDIINMGPRKGLKFANDYIFDILLDSLVNATGADISSIEELQDFNENNTGPLVFFGEEKEKNSYLSSIKITMISNILNMIFEKAMLNAAAVFSNKENYSEILFFEIAKYRTNPGKEEAIPIQRFLLPNDPDFEEVKYFDSQVKYKKAYWYQIYAYTLSIGNTLNRDTLHSEYLDGTGGIANAWDYDNELSVKLLRVPYYNIKGLDTPTGAGKHLTTRMGKFSPGLEVLGPGGAATIVTDAPPLPPNVFYFPYKNVSNKIGFWFNVQLGELKMVPKYDLMNTAQEINMAYYIWSQLGIPLGDATSDIQPVRFKTDDYGGVFEIFRTTERPKSYADFTPVEDKKIAEVSVIGNKTFIDDIVPNQDYYYMFRAVDVHNLPSNPTPVYHFKMITHNDMPEASAVRLGSDSAQPVLFSEIINLDNSYEKKKVQRSFKKYLLIEPSLKQSFFNFEKSTFDKEDGINTAYDVKNQADESLSFGNADVKLFGKKFKIKITSKQTGRKLDINVHFKNPEIKENILDAD